MQSEPIRNTAILIFANSAAKDSVDKKIVADKALFDVLTKTTIKTVRATGLPYFHFTEREQTGDSFGERFVNAIESIYKMGFDNVVTVGNDSPGLKSGHILETVRQLSQGQVVLGPSTDGGFYLMGIHRSLFDAQSLLKLPWQQVKLLQETQRLFNRQGTKVFRLPVLNDLDSEKDVVFLSNFVGSIGKSIMALLRAILKRVQHIIPFSLKIFNSNSPSLQYNKGSPLVFL